LEEYDSDKSGTLSFGEFIELWSDELLDAEVGGAAHESNPVAFCPRGFESPRGHIACGYT
jgi:hypothetical protein